MSNEEEVRKSIEVNHYCESNHHSCSKKNESIQKIWFMNQNVNTSTESIQHWLDSSKPDSCEWFRRNSAPIWINLHIFRIYASFNIVSYFLWYGFYALLVANITTQPEILFARNRLPTIRRIRSNSLVSFHFGFIRSDTFAAWKSMWHCTRCARAFDPIFTQNGNYFVRTHIHT